MLWVHILTALSVTFAAVRVLGQDDVTLTCPQNWTENTPVTLFCEVSKTSIATKCATAPQTTFFKRDAGSGLASLCTVGAADYSSCNFGSPSSTSCGCRQNSTHYTFVYYISSAKQVHDGDWDCDKSCTPSSGFTNPLTKYINPSCNGVTVATADVTTICCTTNIVIGLTVSAELLFIALIVVAILHYIYGYFKCKIVVRVVVVVMAALVVILLCLDIYYACKDADLCCTECVVVIVFVVIDSVVVVIVVITINKREVWIICCACYCFCFATLCCIFCTPNPLTITVTSSPNGSSSDSYELTWTVSGEGSEKIRKFIIEYAKAEVDTSGNGWKVSKVISKFSIEEADGKDQTITLQDLSPSTYYTLRITAVEGICCGAESPGFIFKTAR